jgi:hypothetical protein
MSGLDHRAMRDSLRALRAAWELVSGAWLDTSTLIAEQRMIMLIRA